MAFKDLLLVLQSYPTPTPDETIQHCVDLAASWGAPLCQARRFFFLVET